MAKKYDFKPDKEPSSLLNRLYLTKKQRLSILKWALYGLVLVFLSVLQDVLLVRFRIFGATTELVPVGIFLICVLEGMEQGSVFSLVAACIYLFTGSAAGSYSIVFITVFAILAAFLRQSYLQKGFVPALLSTALAMILYESSVFAIGLFLNLTTPARIIGFAVKAVASLLAVPALYPLTLVIGKIGGEAWKD